VRVLAVRQVRFYLRNPDLVLAKLFTYIFMGCFMGARAAGGPRGPSAPLGAACCGRCEQAAVRRELERWAATEGQHSCRGWRLAAVLQQCMHAMGAPPVY